MAKFKPPMNEVAACSYCRNYLGMHRECGEFGAKYCWDTESPNYNGITKPLIIEQRLVGCEKIKHNGQKIPYSAVECVPKESLLRTLSPEQVLNDFAMYEYLKHRNLKNTEFWNRVL